MGQRAKSGGGTGLIAEQERGPFAQYWPFPASPCRRAVNQKGREFEVGIFGSPNRTRTTDLLVNSHRLQSLWLSPLRESAEKLWCRDPRSDVPAEGCGPTAVVQPSASRLRAATEIGHPTTRSLLPQSPGPDHPVPPRSAWAVAIQPIDGSGGYTRWLCRRARRVGDTVPGIY